MPGVSKGIHIQINLRPAIKHLYRSMTGSDILKHWVLAGLQIGSIMNLEHLRIRRQPAHQPHLQTLSIQAQVLYHLRKYTPLRPLLRHRNPALINRLRRSKWVLPVP